MQQFWRPVATTTRGHPAKGQFAGQITGPTLPRAPSQRAERFCGHGIRRRRRARCDTKSRLQVPVDRGGPSPFSGAQARGWLSQGMGIGRWGAYRQSIQRKTDGERAGAGSTHPAATERAIRGRRGRL